MVPTIVTQPDFYSVPHDQALTVGTPGVLLNDYDTGGATLTAQLNGTPTSGSRTLNSDGSFTFVPMLGFVGSASFQYLACVGINQSAPQIATINVTNQTTVTLTNPGNQTNSDGDPVLLMLNASDSAGNSLTFSATGLPAGLSVNGNLITGTIDANADLTSPYSVKVTATDPTANVSASQTFTWTVAYHTVLLNQSLSVVHGQPLLIDLLDSVPDPGGRQIQFSIANPPAGPMSSRGDGHTYVYGPNTQWPASDWFTFQASYGSFTSNVAMATIGVTDVAPEVADEQFSLHAGNLLKLDTTDGLLRDAVDADSDPLTVQLVGSGPANGALNLQPDGSMMYVARTGFTGDDSFDYRLFDGVAYSAAAHVTVHVEDQAPRVAATSFDVWTQQGISGGAANVLANAIDSDNDPMTAVLVSEPQYASSFHLNADGTFTYTPMSNPPMGFTGADSFSIKADDGTLTSAPTTMTLNWTTQPVAKDGSYVLASSGQVTVSAADGVLANAFNPMNAAITAQLVQGIDPTVGTLNLHDDGSFDFTAGTAFQGEADFSYGLVVAGFGLVQNPFAPIVVRLFANQLAATSIALNSVAFDGNAKITSDLGGELLPPQWLADQPPRGDLPFAQGHEDPISFTRGSTISLRPTFSINPNSQVFWRALGNNLLVRATSNMTTQTGQPLQLGYSDAIPLQMIADMGRGLELATPRFVQMDGALVNSTDYDPLVLTWQFSPDNGLTWITPAMTIAGSSQANFNVSTNPLFITLGNPNGWSPGPVGVAGLAAMAGWVPALTTVTNALSVRVEKPEIAWTTFYVGVEGANGLGATTTAMLLADVWAAFATRDVTTHDGKPMTYWENWDNTAAMLAVFLRTDDGRCGAWSRFFIDVLRAWGGDFSYQANLKQIVVDQENTAVYAEGFLVRNWTFGTPNVAPAPQDGYNWFNLVGIPESWDFAPPGGPPDWRYNWQGPPAVKYTGGSAQNNNNPYATFSDHVLVRIGNILYDPSYGVTYQANVANPVDGDLLRAFQTAALAGYYKRSNIQNLGGRLYVRQLSMPGVADVTLKFNGDGSFQ